MTLAAMSRRLHQVAPAMPLLVPPRFFRQAAFVQEERLPDRQKEAPAERRGNLVRLVRLGNRRLRVDIGLEVADVAVGQMGERGIGNTGKYAEPSGALPSRIARTKSASLQPPMPVSRSGVMLGE